MSAEPSGRALAIGKFDALHLGHRALAERAAALGAPLLLGFAGMAEVLGWPARPPLLAPAERARVLAAWSAQLPRPVAEVTLPFAAIRPLDAAAFVALVRTRCAARALVVGDDFRCGRGRATSAQELVGLAAAQDVEVAIVPPVAWAGAPVSSSRVRQALAAGDLATVTGCLGRPYRVSGTVVRGDGRGRALGVPTANLAERPSADPAGGVYAAWAELDGRRLAAAVNVGHLPTVGAARPLTVEAHLLDWSGDCYDRILHLDLVARLRDERRFSGLEALKAQLALDIAAARSALG